METASILRHASGRDDGLQRLLVRLISAFASVLAAAWAITLVAGGAGPLTLHMVHHIFIMDVAAVAIAWAILPLTVVTGWRPSLAAATAGQVAVLYIWHAPQPFAWAQTQMTGHLAMSMTLLAAATAFWLAVMTVAGHERWRSILALLVTGKLFCLLGAILVFAPRPLYGCGDVSICSGSAGRLPVDAALADQHFAGLLMLAACPITYVLAGVVIATRWIFDLSERDDQPSLSS